MIYIFAFLILCTTSVAGYYSSTALRAVPRQPECCYFTGAGIYFFWQLGCAKYLKENCDIKSLPPIVGASAGSLTATFLLTNTDFDYAVTRAFELAEESKIYERKNGLAGIWAALLRQWLDDVIPDNCSFDELENLHISITPTIKASKLVTGFKSKCDLIDACMASCHVPFFLDGRPFTEYKGEKVFDGSFWYFVTKDRLNSMPIPSGMNIDKTFWVDYGDDEKFMNSISGNFLGIISPTEILNMVDAGYNHMKREHSLDRLPMAITARTGLTLSLEETHDSQSERDDWRERLVMDSERASSVCSPKLKPAQFEEVVILVLSGVRGLALDVTSTAISFANSLPVPDWIRKFVVSLASWLPFPTLPTSATRSGSDIDSTASISSPPNARMAPSVSPLSKSGFATM